MTRYGDISKEVRSICDCLDGRDESAVARRLQALLAMRGANHANVASALAGHATRLDPRRRERILAIARATDPELGPYLDLWVKALGPAS